jgi:hypothetical protein
MDAEPHNISSGNRKKEGFSVIWGPGACTPTGVLLRYVSGLHSLI